MPTRNRFRAQLAYERVFNLNGNTDDPKIEDRSLETAQANYKRFSRKFPALIHTCGLAQAIAFAEAKKQEMYLNHLAYVLEIASRGELAKMARGALLPDYQMLSRDTLSAASWLKRYSEALLKGDEDGDGL